MFFALATTVIVLSLVGLYLAAYFSLIYYHLVKADSGMLPRVCRLEERSCKTVLETKYARVFGPPNSLLGVFYYVIVVVLVGGNFLAGLIGIGLVAVAWFTVVLGIFLIYSLFFIIKIPCPICITAHAINLAVAILLTILATG
jgi:uncharacterized membrane protein